MSRFAVIMLGSHQYRIEENTVFEAERLNLEKSASSEAKEIKLEQVLFLSEDGKIKVGQPFIPKASVTCEVLGELKLPKLISYKIKRRKNSRRKKGHRQTVVRLRVKSIQAE